ncbi:hypothetical protein BU14_0204s0015 [Porphyra umbilicalis]|uniref:Uncharacterized protein n=1 Tax=Porphyra umbilicalis TaxID=2786 RepID=A0A1X6P5I8_PORUM|nr:hypothetical protein BU14_0204s0015 [Porphyra umbilicalis]|eukprot:OSX76169.1 hypothetical protein BU14_0204s0015 [Porphyra umbilicalis]
MDIRSHTKAPADEAAHRTRRVSVKQRQRDAGAHLGEGTPVDQLQLLSRVLAAALEHVRFLLPPTLLPMGVGALWDAPQRATREGGSDSLSVCVHTSGARPLPVPCPPTVGLGPRHRRPHLHIHRLIHVPQHPPEDHPPQPRGRRRPGVPPPHGSPASAAASGGRPTPRSLHVGRHHAGDVGAHHHRDCARGGGGPAERRRKGADKAGAEVPVGLRAVRLPWTGGTKPRHHRVAVAARVPDGEGGRGGGGGHDRPRDAEGVLGERPRQRCRAVGAEGGDEARFGKAGGGVLGEEQQVAAVDGVPRCEPRCSTAATPQRRRRRRTAPGWQCPPRLDLWRSGPQPDTVSKADSFGAAVETLRPPSRTTGGRVHCWRPSWTSCTTGVAVSPPSLSFVCGLTLVPTRCRRIQRTLWESPRCLGCLRVQRAWSGGRRRQTSKQKRVPQATLKKKKGSRCLPPAPDAGAPVGAHDEGGRLGCDRADQHAFDCSLWRRWTTLSLPSTLGTGPPSPPNARPLKTRSVHLADARNPKPPIPAAPHAVHRPASHPHPVLLTPPPPPPPVTSCTFCKRRARRVPTPPGAPA